MGARPRKPVTTPETRERRVGVRVAVDTYIRVAVVHAATGRKIHGWVRDLSPGGLFVEGPDRFETDDAVIVDALARSGDNAVHLRAEGWVAYAARGGMGIQLGHLDPEMAGRLAELIERFG